MWEVIIRQYRDADRAALVRCMEQLQRHQQSLDRWGKIRKLTAGFGERYVTGLLERMKKEEDIVFVAEDAGNVVGCVAGVIERNANDQPMSDCYPCVNGRLLELYVEEEHRRKNVGSLLMEHMESYFREAGVDFLRVEAFAPNTASQDFYRRCGYEVWTMDFIKQTARQAPR